jgi:uncharacterized membrane protein
MATSFERLDNIRAIVARHRGLGSALLAAGVGAALAVVLFSSTGSDDCYITYWSAWSLAEYGEIANYNGVRVEQSSSLLHTVVLALLRVATGGSLPSLAYALGIACFVICVVRLKRLADVTGLEATPLLFLFASTSPLFAYWSLSGLEAPLFAWLLLEVAIAFVKSLEHDVSPWTVGVIVPQVAFVLCRPESFLVSASTLVGVAVVLVTLRLTTARDLVLRRPLRRCAELLLLNAVVFALLALFRWHYFGALAPQTVSAKVSLSWATVFDGALYLQSQLHRADTVVLVAAFVASLAIAVRKRSTPALGDWVPPLLAGAYLGFIVTAGGDWMINGRFVAHVAPLLVYLVLRVLSALAAGRALVARGVLVGLVAINVLALVTLSMRSSYGRPIWSAWQVDDAIQSHAGGLTYAWHERANTVHARDILLLSELTGIVDDLIRRNGEAVVLSGQAGMVFFNLAKRYRGKLEVVDRRGLSTQHLMRVKDQAGLHTTSGGLRVSVRQYFDLSRRHPQALPRPDVVFDIGPRNKDAAAEGGYACAYEQTGHFLSTLRVRTPGHGHRPAKHRWYRQRRPLYQFIATRSDAPPPAKPGKCRRVLRWEQALRRQLKRD